MRSNLPLKFTLCSPGIGFAHGSLKSPLHATDLLHFTEVDDSVQTMYLFGATNLFNVNSPLQLHLISVKHHMEEDWYFADGVVLSIDCSRATEFLLDKAIYDRGPQTLDVMNGTVQRIIPKMFRSRGVPSIQPLLHLKKYTWLVKLLYINWLLYNIVTVFVGALKKLVNNESHAWICIEQAA